MPRKPKTATEPAPCVVLLVKGSDRGLCKTHGCYLVREKVEYDGKKIECWRCPVSRLIL